MKQLEVTDISGNWKLKTTDTARKKLQNKAKIELINLQLYLYIIIVNHK